MNEYKLSNNENLAFFLNEAKSIKTNNFEKKIRVGILGSFTLNGLEETIRVKCSQKRIDCRTFVADYNQYNQEILKQDSKLYQFRPDITFLILDVRHILGELFFSPYSFSISDRKELIKTKIDEMKKLIKTFLNNSNSKLIITSLQIPSYSPYGINEEKADWGLKQCVSEINNRIRDELKDNPLAFVYDFNEFIMKFGEKNVFNYRQFFSGDVKISTEYIPKFTDELMRYIYAITGITRKCIVLDLDNTLWGGIIGEDGISGIQLSDEYPGNVFKAFQRAILGLRDEGVLLSIASKNNVDDVLEVFEKHTDCLLKKSDFSSMQIHWGNKASSIEKISEELNIGLDSIVFFDDNPVERDWVKKQLPKVKVIEVPKNPMDYIKTLNKSRFFDRLTLTNEDRVRADIYQQEQQRKDDLSNAVSVDDFLKDLKVTVKIGFSDDITITRIEQLLNKTNQFNLTTKRHSSADVIKIIRDGGKVLWLSAADRYGDNGIVGVAILVEIEHRVWLIDSLLLSCRVIGRKIETVFLAEIIEILRIDNADVLYGQYLPTKKNSMVSDFYNQHGFQLTDKKNNLWTFNLSASNMTKPNYIVVSTNND